MRSVNLKDIKGTNDGSNVNAITTTGTEADRRTGLFKLNDYTPETNRNSGDYWLASPIPSYSNDLHYVMCNGSIAGASNYTVGVRPVISISNVKLQLKGNVWKIVK